MLAKSRAARLLSSRAARLLSSRPHDVLGVAPGASKHDIKNAYREKAMLHHPDRAPPEQRAAAEEVFKEVSEAFKRLTTNDLTPHEGMSKSDAEELFWQIFGADGDVELAWRVPGRRNPTAPKKSWQQYQILLEASSDEAQLTGGVEARSLYRSCLRSLRGADSEVSIGVREHARCLFAANAHETDVSRIRALLVDGRHSLDELVKSLGTVVVHEPMGRPRLRPGDGARDISMSPPPPHRSITSLPRDEG